MNETHTVVCSSCGVVNASDRSVCSGCGSPLVTVDHLPSSQTPSVKQSKSRAGQLPQWIKALLVVFGLFVVVVIVMEVQQMPSGAVQRNQPAAASEEHNHSDPTIISQISAMETQVTADPKNAGLTLQFANLLHDAKFYPRAVEMYKKYLVLVPDNYDACVDLGICYYETGDLAQAVKEIESVVRKQPKHQMAMFNLGVIQLSAQNLAESNRWLKRCIEIDPQSTAGLRAQQILQQHQ
ncbi:MAG: tetratricopeptide repeat protein [Bacteroidetes bacterium]|nr:tetratricopeptide repeat protein [Bacteroidota bacterium]